MEFVVKSTKIGKQRTPCVVVGIYDSQQLTPAAKQLDKVSKGYLSSILKRGDIKGKIGETLMLHNVPLTACERVLMVGCGKKKELDDVAYGHILEKAATTLDSADIREAYCYLTDLAPDSRDLPWVVRHAVESTMNTMYRFNQLKTKDKQLPRNDIYLPFFLPCFLGGKVKFSVGISSTTSFPSKSASSSPNAANAAK